MNKMQWYRIQVELNVPDREYQSIDIGVDAYSQREAINDAFDMVIQEEGLTEEDRKYLSTSIITNP